MMTKKQTLRDYIEFKRASIKHEGKIKDIERYIGMFLSSSKTDLDKFEEKQLVDFVNKISNKYSIPSLNTIKPILKHFIKWKFENYPVRFRHLDELCRTEKPKSTYNSDEMLTEKEIIKLANAETDLMWKTWWLVYFFGAFRPSEVARLTFSNVDFQKDGTAIIKVYLSKNKRDVYKSIPKPVTDCLKRWKEERPNKENDYIFPSPLREGDHIKAKTGYFRLIKLSKKVLGKKVVPYCIRHSFGSIKYNDPRIDKTIVAEQMGHNKNMEDIYKHLNDDQKITNAKKVWPKKDDLSKEEKHELESKINKQGKQIKQMSEELKRMGKLFKQM